MSNVTKTSIGIFLGLAIALSPALASAGPKGKADVYGGGLVAPKKRTKKQKTIDRLLFTAQYYLLHEQDIDAAVAEYKKVLKLDKNNLYAALALADIEIARKKPKAAVAVLAKLAKKLKKNGTVWRALAVAEKAAGNPKGMKAACQAALKLDPRDGEAHWILFETALARHKAGDATAKEELAAAASGYLASGYLRMGNQRRIAERVMVELKGDEVALAIYDAQAAYDDAFATADFGAINARMAEARRGFEKCTQAQPERQECHYRLGLVYGSIKASEHYDAAKAKASLRKAPDMPEAHVELARLLRVEDDLDGAAAALAKAIKLSPDFGQAHLELGIVRKLDGNEDAAVTSFEKAYEVNRYSSSADRALAELAKIRPKHPLVTGAMMFGDIKGDVFSTDRFKAAVKMVEDQLGGVEEQAPEAAVLEAILARLRSANDVSSRFTFKVAVLKSTMVNAFALPDGSIYFTRGLFDFIRRKWPGRAINADNDVLGHVMGHEMSHVLKRHTVQTLIYAEAVQDSSRWLDPAVLTHVTRLHEVEADRDGIVLAFLAGYHPRGGIEFMEASGKEMEIPSHLDHPTYQERVHYLEEYWSNDVKYAFQSFKLGLASLKKGQALEGKKEAVAAYEEAVDHFKRVRTVLKGTKDVLNNLGIAYAKVGRLGLGRGSPLTRWRTRFSIEEQSALKYVGIVREQTRGGAKNDKDKKEAEKVPWQLREAISVFEEALKLDSTYLKARVNLALCHLALGRVDDAEKDLASKGVGDQKSGELDLVRGIILAEQKKLDAAQDAFTRALKVKGASGPARYNLARVYHLAGKNDAARSTYQAYLKEDPAGPWHDAAARALKKL